jgi:hypothetical protein
VKCHDAQCGVELSSLVGAAFEAATTVRAVARNALLEHFDQQVNVRKSGQPGEFGPKCRTQRLHNA